MHLSRKIALGAASSMAIMFGGVPIASATYTSPCPPPPPPTKIHCNAGNGNGNEGCDPGNSAPQNRGGDEVLTPPPSNSTPNPGGNNT